MLARAGPKWFSPLACFQRSQPRCHTGHVALGSENLNLERSDDRAFVKRRLDEEQCMQWRIGGRERVGSVEGITSEGGEVRRGR